MMTGFVDRVAVQAVGFRPTRGVLWALAAPFYVLGFLFGLLWLVGSFAYGAVRVGIVDAKERAGRPAAGPVEGG